MGEHCYFGVIRLLLFWELILSHFLFPLEKIVLFAKTGPWEVFIVYIVG